jgi:hypothetical protein
VVVFVIPGRAKGASPESIYAGILRTDFRVRAVGARLA